MYESSYIIYSFFSFLFLYLFIFFFYQNYHVCSGLKYNIYCFQEDKVSVLCKFYSGKKAIYYGRKFSLSSSLCYLYLTIKSLPFSRNAVITIPPLRYQHFLAIVLVLLRTLIKDSVMTRAPDSSCFEYVFSERIANSPTKRSDRISTSSE